MATAVRAMRGGLPSQNQWSSVMPLSDIPYWYTRAVQTVMRLADQAENWDGYGSLNIQIPARTRANELLAILSINGASAPHIAPLSGGGLQFEWEFAGRELELEILPTGDIDFLTTSPNGEMLQGEVPDPKKQIPLLFGWLITGEFTTAASYLENRYATSP